MAKKYSYHSILEINGGKLILCQDLVRHNYPARTNYKNADAKAFYKSILESVLQSNIGIMDLMIEPIARNFAHSPREETSLNPRFIDLIIEIFGHTSIAKNIPIPDYYGHIHENSESKVRNEDYVSFLAINHYLKHNNSSYINDLSKLQSVIDFVHNTYIGSKRIKFLSAPLVKDIGTHSKHLNTEVLKYIYQYIINCIDTDTFYLFGTSAFREIDLYENHGLWEYEAEDSYNTYQTRLFVNQQETAWNDNFIESLKLISEDTKTKLFIRVKYDFPITDGYKLYPL